MTIIKENRLICAICWQQQSRAGGQDAEIWHFLPGD
jgi:hypothetical protein